MEKCGFKSWMFPLETTRSICWTTVQNSWYVLVHGWIFYHKFFHSDVVALVKTYIGGIILCIRPCHPWHVRTCRQLHKHLRYICSGVRYSSHNNKLNNPTIDQNYLEILSSNSEHLANNFFLFSTIKLNHIQKAMSHCKSYSFNFV